MSFKEFLKESLGGDIDFKEDFDISTKDYKAKYQNDYPYRLELIDLSKDDKSLGNIMFKDKKAASKYFKSLLLTGDVEKRGNGYFCHDNRSIELRPNY